MAGWDKLSAILALSIAIFAILPNLPLLYLLFVSLLRLLRAPSTRCQELLWKDVPEGELHECPLYGGCQHTVSHTSHGFRCWENLLSVVFSRAWADKERQKRRVLKPRSLPLKEDFLQVDFTVLMAFIISTLGCSASLGSLMLGISTYTDGDRFVFDACGAERLEVKVCDEYLVAHLFAKNCRPWSETGERRIRSWSKVEIENFLNGYPPFYSEKITLRNNQSIPFPINAPEDIRKGGWILAVKLGNITTALPFYFESQPTTSDTHRKPTFQLATEWVREMVIEPFSKTFPSDPNVLAASKALKGLCNGQEYIDCPLEGSDLDENLPFTLDKNAAIKAMAIFNGRTRMTATERAHLKAATEPMLVPLLSAAVFGTRDVLRFEKKCVNFKEKLPPAMRPSSKIFVRDCLRTGFDTARRHPGRSGW
jgi:hypothetical protein